MRLGVDFGTTRTLVATVDRGNYPVVTFLDGDGDASEHYPSVVAAVGGKLVYGFDALRAAQEGAPLLRSFKRALAAADVTADTPLRVGDVERPLSEVLVGFLASLREALRKKSNISRRKQDTAPETVIAVPAHAHGAQRFLTLDAFRRAGFDVKAMINEPSAAGFEYTHRQGKTVNARRTRVVVYDLGGGTFDASLVKVDGVHHDVLATAGLNKLGGDDFDMMLAKCALKAAGVDDKTLGARDRARLLDQCREAKERITPQSKRIALEVPAGSAGGVDREVNVAVEAFYEACAPLVAQTVDAMKPLLRQLDGAPGGTGAAGGAGGNVVDVDALTDIAGIYLVGGGSGLPLVPRVLKEVFGRRVHRSPHPAASTAIGLAIAADDEAGFALADRLSRGFGVFRERAEGRAVTFDAIFLPDAAMPTTTPPRAGNGKGAAGPGAVVVSRRYRAAHNVGWFRFVECTNVDESGEPRGDLLPFAEVLFPFDPALQAKAAADLRAVPVERRELGHEVEERYVIDGHGLVEVQIADLSTGYSQTHRIGA